VVEYWSIVLKTIAPLLRYSSTPFKDNGDLIGGSLRHPACPGLIRTG
jgi:hypothetical protein